MNRFQAAVGAVLDYALAFVSIAAFQWLIGPFPFSWVSVAVGAVFVTALGRLRFFQTPRPWLLLGSIALLVLYLALRS